MNKGLVIWSSALLFVAGGCGPQTQADRDETNQIAMAPKSKGDGPFGLSLSSKPSALDINDDSSEKDVGFYILDSVPSPSSDFETYAVVAHEIAGICEIRAVSQTFENDTLGSEATALVDKLAKSLESKYGTATKTDACGGNDVSCQNQFWAMSVMNGERAYGYEWKKPKDSIRKITIFVNSDDLARLSVRLDYETGDMERCEKAENSARSNNL